MVYSMMAQLINVSVWKCFKIGGIILTVTGFFQWAFVMDHMSERFLIFCTFIGLLVVIYSGYYIFNSEINLFRGIIILFITRILILTRRSNMITMFIGWEGVGVISFVLIGWFISRERAISASSYAFIFNRFADFFFLILLVWEIGGQHRLFYLQFLNTSPNLNNVTEGMLILVMASFWIATAGKSAQFLFHPWLTLAIEGPTPVRRLLHSRTIVVAGVYLLLKLHPLIISLNWLGLNNVIFISRLVTMMFTSIWAISQVDIKKIIALSTTRQLRLIIIMCCLSQYDLVFLHILLHGFFKALLFLGSGVTIHNNSTNNQNISKINLLMKDSTFIHTVFTIGVLGLIGAPFIGSFHRKHLILDVTQYLGSLAHYLDHLRSLAYVGLYMSPVITLGYSLKLLSFISQKPSSVTLSSSYINGSSSDLKVVVPMFLLATSRFVVGLTIRRTMRGGMSTSLSLEDVYYSLFVFVLFLALFYNLLLIPNSVNFIYNHSRSIVRLNLLHIRDILMLFFYHLVEYLSLKKGLKSVTPNFNVFENGQRYLLFNFININICIFTFLQNLSTTISFTIFYFIILF